MTLRALRRLVAVTCIAAIGGMIAASIADNDAAAMTAGSAAGIGVLCLLVATSVVRAASPSRPHTADEAEHLGALLEEQVARLVVDGAPEGRVREVVATAVRLGRSSANGTNRPQG